MKIKKVFLLCLLLVTGCASNQGRKLSKEEISNLNLKPNTEFVNCSGNSENQFKTCHKYRCVETVISGIECDELEPTAEDITKVETKASENSCVFVNYFKDNTYCTKNHIESKFSLQVVCIGSDYIEAAKELRGQCVEEKCDKKNKCTIKGNKEVLQWYRFNVKK